jgi:hypothetical protein
MFARIDSNVSMLRAEQARQSRIKPLLSAGCTVSKLNQGCLHELVPIAARWGVSLCLSPIFFVLDPQNQRSAQRLAPNLKTGFSQTTSGNVDPLQSLPLLPEKAGAVRTVCPLLRPQSAQLGCPSATALFVVKAS